MPWWYHKFASIPKDIKGDWLYYRRLIRFLFFQDGLHVLSPEEQFKWLKSKEEACLAGLSSNASAATGEQSIMVFQATHTLNISHTRVVHMAFQTKHTPPNLSDTPIIHVASQTEHPLPNLSHSPTIRVTSQTKHTPPNLSHISAVHIASE
jgi:hypothetical protein